MYLLHLKAWSFDELIQIRLRWLRTIPRLPVLSGKVTLNQGFGRWKAVIYEPMSSMDFLETQKNMICDPNVNYI
nr:hypothetical protein [Candidatus Cloacimonadota bacterium]